MQETNRKLKHLCELIREQESGPLHITAPDLANLSSELKSVEQLRARANSSDGSLHPVFIEYRNHLENLRDILPGLQARYITERARLECDRAHQHAASGWVQSQELLYRR